MTLSISVAICTFNGSQFLPVQLHSIAAQSRAPDEVIICDDCSTDGSDRLSDEFATRMPFPVRVCRNPRNLGSTRNFEQAISQCTGAIIVLADQDDAWYPHKLERIEKAFLDFREAVGVFSDADLMDDTRSLQSRLWESYSLGPRDQRRLANGEALKVLVRHPVITGATMAFRREFWNRIFPIPPNHIHDNWIAFLLSACGPWVPVAEPLMQYRRHGKQQIGPGLVTLRERLAQARKTGPEFYRAEIERFRQLQERLESRREDFPLAGVALREIAGKISHREHRAKLPHAPMARISTVLREVFNGGYWRYSEGWESVAKDMAGIRVSGNRSVEHSIGDWS